MEPEWTLITKPGCAACEELKQLVESAGIEDILTVMNIDTPEGMAVAALHETLEKRVPYIIFENDHGIQIIDVMDELKAAVNIVRKIKQGKEVKHDE